MSSTIRTSTFENSVGVNVHVEYTDGKYASASTVVQDLAYLGISQVRDAALNPANQGQSSYGVLAEAGIKFDMIAMGTNIGSTLSLMDAFEAAHPGSISAIEGPNEINNWAISFDGLSGTAAGAAYQNSLYASVAGDSLLKGLPVYDLSNDSYVAGLSNDVNVHAYPKAGAQPFAALQAGLAQTPGVTSKQGAVLTEAGYYTLTDGVGWGGVSQQAQATMTLNLLMDATKLGYSQTYLYQLLDAYADPNGTNPDDHFGLFDLNNNPKPVATAIHNLMSILSDSGSNASSFATGSLNYNVTGLPSSGSSLLMEKSSGAYDIVVWNEPTVWNAATETAVTAKPTTVTVNLGGTFTNVSVYDPMTGTTAVASAHDASSIQVSLTDHPLIIEVSGQGTGSSQTTVSGQAPASSPSTVSVPSQPSIAGTVITAHGSGGLASPGGNATAHVGENDLLMGTSGVQTFVTSTGVDNIQAGTGKDSFVFQNLADFGPGHNADTIYGFNAGAGDTIDLHTLDYGYLIPNHMPKLQFIGDAPFTDVAGQLHYTVDANGAGITLSGDVNGDGVADFSVHLAGIHSILSANIVF